MTDQGGDPWPGWRWYLTGTATIWRHGGTLRDAVVDVRNGLRWAHRARPGGLGVTDESQCCDHADGTRCVLPVREDLLNFPTAWRLAREGVQHTDPRCSYVQHDGGLLCDCGAIETEWARRVAEQQAERTTPEETP